MQILFRTDASTDIGTGHVMRCSALAEILHASGTSIHFACRYLPDTLRNMLLNKGFKVSILEQTTKISEMNTDCLAHSSWLGVSQSEDAYATLDIINNNTFDWIIVDHYALDKSWEMIMRQATRKIMVIDDLADREHTCDLLLDQNYYLDRLTRYEGLVPKHCQMLLGPTYALLRDEFHQFRAQVNIRSGPVKSILVFFGGVDQLDCTSRAVTALSNIHNRTFTVDVVIGAQHPNREALIAQCSAVGFTLHIQTNQMAQLMSKADLAIGGGGGAVWERACLKLPTISLPIAEHQVMQLHDLSKDGIIYSYNSAETTLENIQKHLEILIDNSALRHLFSHNSAKLVDGYGTSKVSRILLGYANLSIRLATSEDEQDIYKWRNSPEIRAVSFTNEEISIEQHKQWFRSSLANPNKLILIGERNENPVGVVRFDIFEEFAEVSIYLIQDLHNKGLGQSLLHSAEEWLIRNRKDITTIKANVLEDNINSQRFFIRACYKPVYRSYEKAI